MKIIQEIPVDREVIPQSDGTYLVGNEEYELIPSEEKSSPLEELRNRLRMLHPFILEEELERALSDSPQVLAQLLSAESCYVCNARQESKNYVTK